MLPTKREPGKKGSRADGSQTEDMTARKNPPVDTGPSSPNDDLQMGETMVEDLTKAVARLANARPNVEPAGLSFESKICRDINRYGKIFYCGYQYKLNTLGSVAARNVRARNLDVGSKSKPNDDIDMSEFDDISDKKYVGYIMYLNQVDSSESDFYQILGLSKLRQQATSAQIKAAYHRLILTHHPDKGSASNSILWKNSNLYFPCILRAYDVLSNPMLRRSYDSCDPSFDDSVPSVKEYSNDEFFAAFSPAFKRNACWSKIKPVPLLGDMNTDISEVRAFYNFWSHFQSWRECTWDVLSTLNQFNVPREIRRSMMRYQNVTEGRFFKKDERKRISLLVNSARKCDPRIKQYEMEMEQKKIEERRRKSEARRLAAEAERARKMQEEEQARLQKEQELEKARQEALALKRQKHAAKKAISKEKKKIVAHLEKHDYFAAVGGDKLKFMENEVLLETVLTIDEMKQLNAKLEEAGSVKDAMQAYMEVSAKIDEHINAEREKLEQQQKEEAEKRKNRLTCSQADENWSDEDRQLVIRGIWNLIADYVNRHSTSGGNRTPKAVAAVAKEMLNSSDKASRANATAAGTLNLVKKKRAVVEAAPTTRYDYEAAEADEKAIKMYPPGTPKRWERIIMKLPRRTQVACLRRYNEVLRLLGDGNREAFVAYVNPGEVRPWTAEEEKRFESAVINFPPGSEDRLKRITEMVETRTEEECQFIRILRQNLESKSK
ncbi:DnaJ -like protein subfamily C member 2 [Trichinella murrelli]|uniref:DnaJ-like protein subfamily C member 2 n=1 Tax=Trichinella murrelli TaxID=144512 RepID=A0A0V0T904_9BILA|nr:DnaJ -like protein subfamily C member 2 [Trichinella murrelli]